MDELEGVKRIHSRLIHAKILVVDDDFQDTEDGFLRQHADVIMTRDGVVVKSRLTRVPVDVDLEQCNSGGHLEKLKTAIVEAAKKTRKIELG